MNVNHSAYHYYYSWSLKKQVELTKAPEQLKVKIFLVPQHLFVNTYSPFLVGKENSFVCNMCLFTCVFSISKIRFLCNIISFTQTHTFS